MISGEGDPIARSNLDIDKELLAEAFRLGGKRTKHEVVNLALREYIGKRKQMEILDIFGTACFHPLQKIAKD